MLEDGTFELAQVPKSPAPVGDLAESGVRHC